MECPMLRTEYVWPSGSKEVELDDCHELRCAWWDKKSRNCAVLLLATKQVKVSVAR